MLARTPLRDQMIAWLDTKNPATIYDWHDTMKCACGQFAHDTGQLSEWCSGGNFFEGTVWTALNYAASRKPWTFGALRARLEP